MRTREDVQKLFDYFHLPPHLQDASKPFHDLAMMVFDVNAENPRPHVMLCLHKLWEAKNYAVWCAANMEDTE